MQSKKGKSFELYFPKNIPPIAAPSLHHFTPLSEQITTSHPSE